MMKRLLTTISIILSSLCLSGFTNVTTKNKLNDIFQWDTLGQRIQYFESHYGVAKRVSGHIREYDFSGCTVNIYEDNNQSISSMELVNISQKCDFKLKNLFQFNKNINQITFNDLIDFAIDKNVDESCYASCGNAVDPQYGILLGLPHVYGFKKIHIKVGYIGEKDGDKYERGIQSSIDLNKKLEEKFGKSYDLKELLNNKNNRNFYTTEWIKYFGSDKINSFRFGDVDEIN